MSTDCLRPARRKSTTARGFAWLLVGAVVLGGVARAQLLADVLVTTAIAAQFDGAVRFPSGSLRAVGAGADAIRARVPDHATWQDWEVYTARGIATALQPAFVHQISTAYAVAGYFERERSERTVPGPAGSETHLRLVFAGDDGTRLLYLIRSGQEVVWLTARSR
ncbi:MAG: hypothetical protein R6W77_04060 [Trueperaceae bacterium]